MGFSQVGVSRNSTSRLGFWVLCSGHQGPGKEEEWPSRRTWWVLVNGERTDEDGRRVLYLARPRRRQERKAARGEESREGGRLRRIEGRNRRGHRVKKKAHENMGREMIKKLAQEDFSLKRFLDHGHFGTY
jgi:hypothetical protein